MKLFLVEDDPSMQSALQRTLSRRGIEVTVCGDGTQALAAWTHTHPDVVMLDLTLPGMDGLLVLEQARRQGLKTPVLILTARGTVGDRIVGLNTGADDYLPKPFDLDELEARLRALHRRPYTLRADQAVVGRLTYDFRHREALIDDQTLDLPRRERLVLETLIRRPGRTVMRSALEEAVYALDDEIGSNALDAHISRLRRKLDDLAAGIEIRAIRNLGYLLRAAS